MITELLDRQQLMHLIRKENHRFFRGGPLVTLNNIPAHHLVDKAHPEGCGIYLDGGVPKYFLSKQIRVYESRGLCTRPYVGSAASTTSSYGYTGFGLCVLGNYNNECHREKHPSYHYKAGYPPEEPIDHVYVRLVELTTENVNHALGSLGGSSDQQARSIFQTVARILEEVVMMLVGARPNDEELKRWLFSHPVQLSYLADVMSQSLTEFLTTTSSRFPCRLCHVRMCNLPWLGVEIILRRRLGQLQVEK